MKRVYDNKMKKMNNKGMTLVEVLMAIIILSVSLTAFFRIFISSKTFDGRAKNILRESDLSQGIMEKFKAYSMDEVMKQFNGTADFKIYTGTHGTTSALYVPANDSYQFAIQDVEFDGQTYVVYIEAAPNETFDGSKISMMKTDSIDKYNDAVFIQPTNNMGSLAEKIIDDIFDKIGIDNNADPINKDTIKWDKINIESKVNNINIVSNFKKGYVDVSSTYTYSFADDYIVYTKDGSAVNMSSVGTKTCKIGSRDTDDVQNVEYSIYDNNDTYAAGARLENVYFYYYPEYDVDSEKILVNATGADAEMVDLHIIKQIPLGIDYDTFELDEKEINYNPTVEFVTGSETRKMTLHQNLTSRLDNPGSVNNLTVNNFKNFDFEYTKNKDNLLTKEDDKCLNYDVTVTIYDAGGSSELHTIYGSKNDR